MTRRDWQELAFAAFAGALLIAGTLAIVVLVPKEEPTRPQLLDVPSDKPLMTEQERAWALEDGVAGFWFDGTYYVASGLDPVYWRQERR